MKSKIFCLVLNYRHYDQTLNCLKALMRADPLPNTQFLVIDNSKPTNPKLLKKIEQLPNTSTLISPKNLGFAAGNNQGIRKALKAKATHILIINPDVTVPKVFFKPLLKNFNHNSRLGLVAPAIKHYQNGQTRFGLEGSVNWTFAKATHINLDKNPGDAIRPAQFVTFACVLIAAPVFKKIGYLDERFFMYLEDVDFCLRAKKAKIDLCLDPKVTVTHLTSSSFSNPVAKLPISFVSQVKFIFKWLSFPKSVIALIYQFTLYSYLFLLWEYHFLKQKYR